ncbi:HAMP domain-containing sensor histidine kinase [Massilia sp.]|uniref:sensor histidine kinase n=1 Tax=Massilia sp. TaxID=1882437 RepID=UPI00289839CC|nr:HAMP domain-containing sensor histidine kinase [Massilia sp.]
MDTTEAGERRFSSSTLADTLALQRASVLTQWTARVGRPDGPLMAQAAPALLDEVAAALAGNTPARAAGLAPLLPPGRHDTHALTLELQSLRATLFTALMAHQSLSARDVELVGVRFDAWLLAAAALRPPADPGISGACISGFAHDLRNPLSVASATAQLIGLKSEDPGVAGLAGRIVKKIADVDALIQTLQDAAVQHGGKGLKLQISAFDIMALVEEVCVDLPLVGQPVSIIGERIDGHWCRAAMKRALENLVTRARKHGKRSGPITVRVTRDGEQMGLSIHNHGPAIAGEDMARLFDPPVHAEEIAFKGWNLGLPYVRSVAESHGGAMAVDSGETSGTTFTLHVPVDARAYAAA